MVIRQECDPAQGTLPVLVYSSTGLHCHTRPTVSHQERTGGAFLSMDLSIEATACQLCCRLLQYHDPATTKRTTWFRRLSTDKHKTVDNNGLKWTMLWCVSCHDHRKGNTLSRWERHSRLQTLSNQLQLSSFRRFRKAISCRCHSGLVVCPPVCVPFSCLWQLLTCPLP